MLSALYSSLVDDLFVTAKLLESCVQGKDLPLTTLLDKARKANTSAEDRLDSDEELDTGDVSGGVDGHNLGSADSCGAIDGKLLQPEAILGAGAALEKLLDARRALDSAEDPRKREVVAPVAVIDKELRERGKVALG